ncbi:MAG: hypothetical protein JO105_22755 [Hyphomicrobiales bacterium]|nr:hypothetical protein [Hyphomicrobiales bacterium]
MRALSDIEADLDHVQKRTIADILETGRLLVEARQHIGGHGKWLIWLKSMAISHSTSIRHIRAAEFAENRHVATLENLSATALYYLSEMDAEDDKALIEAVLREADTRRVNRERIFEIQEELEAAKTDDDGGTDDTEDSDEGVEGDNDDDPPSETDPAREEADAILDGKPPDLPPTEGAPSTGETAFPQQLSDFDNAVADLLRLSTKPARKFYDTTHPANDLQKVADFVAQIARPRGEESAPAEKQDDAADDGDDDEVPAHLRRPPIPREPADSDEPPRPSPDVRPPRPRLKHPRP